MKKFIKWIFDPRTISYINYAALAIFGLCFIIVYFADAGTYRSMKTLIEDLFIYGILAVSLGMVVGFLGELSLGHAGFMCIGAFVGGKIALMLSSTAFGNSVWTLIIAIIAGGLIAAFCGFIVGLPALRLRGDYLAIVTLAFVQIVCTVVMQLPENWFGGPSGLSTKAVSTKYLFIVAFVVLFICLAFTQNLVRSKHGRAITAIRDNEIAARSMGINITKYKLFVFIAAAFFAGVAGVLIAYQKNTITTLSFDYNKSIDILIMVVLGGIGSIGGSMYAAFAITFLTSKLQTSLPPDMAYLQFVIYAVVLILVVIYRNTPKLKHFRERVNLKTVVFKIFKIEDDLLPDSEKKSIERQKEDA